MELNKLMHKLIKIVICYSVIATIIILPTIYLLVYNTFCQTDKFYDKHLHFMMGLFQKHNVSAYLNCGSLLGYIRTGEPRYEYYNKLWCVTK